MRTKELLNDLLRRLGADAHKTEGVWFTGNLSRLSMIERKLDLLLQELGYRYYEDEFGLRNIKEVMKAMEGHYDE